MNWFLSHPVLQDWDFAMQYTRVRTFQHNQAPRHYYLVQALVDCPATCHVLHVAGQHYLVHALVEVPATGQVLQAAGQN